MQALIFERPDRPVVVDVPMPEIDENGVLLKMKAVGICHSDYELLAGRYIIPISYPGDPRSRIGRRGRRDRPQRQELQARRPRRRRMRGQAARPDPPLRLFPRRADREFLTARPEWLHKLPDGIADKQAALIEPFTCGYYAVSRMGGTNASETVVVSGGGTIGLVSAATAIGMRARTIVIDPLQHRRETALKLGADAVIDPLAEDAVERVRELTGGAGADLVIEAAGHDASLASVFDLAREEGRVAMVGINIGRSIGSHLGNIQMRNLTVKGCIGSPGVWPSAIRFLERTGLDLSPIQTHDFPLAEAVKAFDLGKQSDKCIKVTLLNA